MQSQSWGVLKSRFGWDAIHVTNVLAGAQILFRRLPLGLKFAYIPKGPVGETCDDLWPLIDEECRRRKAVFLKVEPDVWEDPNDRSQPLPPPGYRLSPHAIQPKRTILVDLGGDEEDILARMKQKTRYNIRLAMKKGVKVHLSDDISSFYKMMQITGDRGAFGVHTKTYYQCVFDLFSARGQCALLLAKFENQELAALMVFASGSRAWYLYGGSSNLHRNLMPSYFLQWEAMRWARQKGCTQYDLWGIPDETEEILEANFRSRSDGLWGVYRNKRGFGGEVKRAVGPWDRVYNPALYTFYRFWIERTMQ